MDEQPIKLPKYQLDLSIIDMKAPTINTLLGVSDPRMGIINLNAIKKLDRTKPFKPMTILAKMIEECEDINEVVATVLWINDRMMKQGPPPGVITPIRPKTIRP